MRDGVRSRCGEDSAAESARLLPWQVLVETHSSLRKSVALASQTAGEMVMMSLSAAAVASTDEERQRFILLVRSLKVGNDSPVPGTCPAILPRLSFRLPGYPHPEPRAKSSTDESSLQRLIL